MKRKVYFKTPDRNHEQNKKRVEKIISEITATLCFIIIGITLLLLFKSTDKEADSQILRFGTICFFADVVFSVLIANYLENRCPHGIHNGHLISNGGCKCPQCQEEYVRIQLEKGVHLEYEEKQKQEQVEIIRKERERKKQLKNDYDTAFSKAEESKRRILLSSTEIINKLTPFEFEDYIAKLLKELGYENIVQTPYQNDGGKDIICDYQGSKVFIECKHYKSDNTISRPYLQKLFAAMTENDVSNGIFITTSSFSSEAIKYGKQFGIRTIDGKELAGIITKTYQQNNFSTEYSLPCPECGKKVTFSYLDKPFVRRCSNGHMVKGVSDIQLFPKEKPVGKY